MFKKSRKRIVVSIMGVLTLLWITTLCAIFLFSYFEISSVNKTMLRAYANRYAFDKPVEWDDDKKPLPGPMQHWNQNQIKLTTFYVVVFDDASSVIEVRNDPNQIYTDIQLEEYAKEALNKRSEYGSLEDLIYYKENKEGNQLVIFMDNTILSESINTLFRYTAVVGLVIMIALYFVAVFLARRIVAPLEESDLKQRQFISDAGHELKTPISIINANLDLLDLEIKDNRWLNNIRYENERMSRLVVELLDLARTEQRKSQMLPLDLGHIIEGEILVFESMAYEQGIVLTTDTISGLMVKGDSTQLKQVFTILMDNAIEHSQDAKEIWISLSKERGWAKLSVKNKGKEIPQEQQKHLFERFFRIDEARTGNNHHYGLGLAIAKAILDNHHGKIEVCCYDGFVEFIVMIPLI